MRIEPERQGITARARVELEALEASRFADLELHPNLSVASATTADGRPVSVERNADEPLRLRLTLPDLVAAGSKVAVVLDYAGPLANAEGSPARGIRLAYVSRDEAWLLLAGRWFPLTGFPGNRYTGVFRVVVPETMAVVGTGKAAPPAVFTPPPLTAPARPSRERGEPAPPAVPAEKQVVYTFRSDRPEAAGTFLAGNLQLVPVSAEGLNISVFVPPAVSRLAAAHGQAVAEIINFFSAQFGPLPEPNVALAQLPDGAVPGYAAPGLLLLAARRWEEKPSVRALAQLVAQQWWGQQVLPASSDDVWIADGLARYAEGLYREGSAGEAGLNAVLEDVAVGALTYEDAAPITQASRLGLFSSEYRSVVVNKGAMVFHMLRHALGEQAFRSLLREFYAKYAGKSARIEDLRELAEQAAQGRSDPFSLTPFFTQWLNSTGVPEFKLEYVVYRTQKGFKIVGKVRQDLETFRMPLGLRVDTEGNPELKTIEVRGTESDFTIETFGRPKPGGITLDPHNQLLKSSPRLRVRAAIARGEELAEAARFYDAMQHYQQAIALDKNSSLAHFRMGEALFYQKNPQAAANAFRNAIDGDLEPKWVQVWSHIYLGKIFDLAGLRERAVNEYQRAAELHDDTGGAQAEVQKYLKEPYKEDSRPGTNGAAATAVPTAEGR